MTSKGPQIICHKPSPDTLVFPGSSHVSLCYLRHSLAVLEPFPGWEEALAPQRGRCETTCPQSHVTNMFWQ